MKTSFKHAPWNELKMCASSLFKLWSVSVCLWFHAATSTWRTTQRLENQFVQASSTIVVAKTQPKAIKLSAITSKCSSIRAHLFSTRALSGWSITSLCRLRKSICEKFVPSIPNGCSRSPPSSSKPAIRSTSASASARRSWNLYSIGTKTQMLGDLHVDVADCPFYSLLAFQNFSKFQV